MSDELYLLCMSHDPMIKSDPIALSTSQAALTAARTWIAHRELIGTTYAAGLGVPGEVAFAAGAFLAAHPRCQLGLVDQNGQHFWIAEGGMKAEPHAADQWMDQWRIVPTGPVERGGEMRRPEEAK